MRRYCSVNGLASIVAALAVGSGGLARDVGAQFATEAVVAAAARAPVPFATGERLTYDVKYGKIKVGTGTMTVVGTEDVRGREAWRTLFTVQGGIPGVISVNDRQESWFDTRTLHSLRFVQSLREAGKERDRHFEIYPERGVYVDEIKGRTSPSVRDPLDDGAFLYFIRTTPLEVGRTYEFDRYFRPDRNPVRLHVLRRETVEVPAGRFQTIVVQPIIKTSGMFGEDGRAEVWLTDDARRIIVQMKSSMKVGSLNLYLKSIESGRRD